MYTHTYIDTCICIYGAVFNGFSHRKKSKEQEGPLQITKLVTDPVLIPEPDESRTGIVSSRSSGAHATLGPDPDPGNNPSTSRMGKVQVASYFTKFVNEFLG